MDFVLYVLYMYKIIYNDDNENFVFSKYNDSYWLLELNDTFNVIEIFFLCDNLNILMMKKKLYFVFGRKR